MITLHIETFIVVAAIIFAVGVIVGHRLKYKS